MFFKLFTTFSLLFALGVAIVLGNRIYALANQIGEKDREDFIHSLSQNTSGVSAEDATEVAINGRVVTVEIADTQEKRSEGLMYRNYLPPVRGMLFVFPREGSYSFWMKNTKIPLDIIWIDENLKIVHIEDNVKPCLELVCPKYSSPTKAKYVLETNANWAHNAKASTRGLVKSLIATISISFFSIAILKADLPIRPNPFIAIRVLVFSDDIGRYP